MNRRTVLTLANLLTVLRIVLVPVYLWLFSRQNWQGVTLSLLVFIAAALTDLVDGRLARSRKEVTKLGKFLDPLADKFLVVGALVQFWLAGLVNVWLVAVIVIRDLWVTAMRISAIMRGAELATSGDAKLKTTIQLTAIITTITLTAGRLVAMTFLPEYDGVWVDIAGYRMLFNLLVFIAAAFTVYSWAGYLIRGRTAKV